MKGRRDAIGRDADRALIILLLLVVAVGPAGADDTAPRPGFIADVRTTLTFPDVPGRATPTPLVTEAKVLKAGPLVRYENQDMGPTAPRPEEVQIYDFAARRFIRLILSQHIAFESLIPPRFIARARREGLAPPEPEPGIVVQRLRLGEAVVEGHPTDILLLVRGPADRKGRPAKPRPGVSREYTLIWEARDTGPDTNPLHGLPLRVFYSQVDRSVVLVEYRNLRPASFDPALFLPPADFLRTSPF